MMEGLTERVLVRVLHRSARACLLSYKWREMIDSAFRMLLLIRRAVTQCPPVSAAEARACVSRTTTQFVDNNRRSLVSMMRAETPTSQARPACVLAGMRHCCHHRGVWSEEEDEDDDELITKTTCPTWGKKQKTMNDSRVADVYSGEDLVEVLCREAVEAAAVGQQLVELLDGHLAAAAAGSRRDISRWLLLLFGRTQVLLHGSLSPRLPLDDRRLHTRPAAQLHLTFARESCAFCLLVYKVSV